MTAPWGLVALSSTALPFLSRARELRPRIWFAWWWSVGNLAMFCLWSVAKPNYFLPCLPGVALLIGVEWVRLTDTPLLVLDLEGNPQGHDMSLQEAEEFVNHIFTVTGRFRPSHQERSGRCDSQCSFTPTSPGSRRKFHSRGSRATRVPLVPSVNGRLPDGACAGVQ